MALEDVVPQVGGHNMIATRVNADPRFLDRELRFEDRHLGELRRICLSALRMLSLPYYPVNCHTSVE